MASIGSLTVDLMLQSTQFIAGMRRAAEQTEKTSKSIKDSLDKADKAVKGLAAAFAVDWIAGKIQDAFDYGDAIVDLADKTGATTKSIQEMRYAAQMSGSSFEDADAALGKFTKTLGEAQAGDAAANKKLAELGVTSRDVDVALRQAADGVQKLGSKQQQNAAALSLFGKAAGSLTAMLASGSEGMEEMAEQARNLGLIMGEDLLRNAGQVNDSMDQLKMLINVQFANVILQNADAFASMAQGMMGVVSAFAQFWQQNPRAAMGLLGAGAGFMAGGPVGAALGGIAGVYAGNAMDNAARASNPKLYAARQELADAQAAVDGLKKPRLNTNYFDPDLGFGLPQADDRVDPKAAKARLAKAKAEVERLSLGSLLGAMAKPDLGKLPGAKATASKPSGKSAAELARDAFQKEMDWKNEWMNGEGEYLGLKERRATNPNDIRDYQLQQNDISTQQRQNSLDAAGPMGSRKYSADQLGQLKAQEDSIAAEKAKLITLEADERIARDRLDLQTAGLGNERDLLSAAQGLARTEADRRAVGMRLIDLQYRQEKLALEAVTASAASTDAEKAIAAARLAMLDKLKTGDIANLKAGTMGPMASYLDAIPRTVGEINESLENVAVEGLGGFQDGLFGCLKGTASLGAAFESMTGSILDGLAKIALQQAIIKPLGDFLFGGGDGGGSGLFGGVLKGLSKGLLGPTPGARANGGMTRAGDYLVGERGPELVSIGNLANVTPNHALRGVAGRAGGGVTISFGNITSNDPVAVRQQISEALMLIAPSIRDQATKSTIKQLNRPRM